MAGHKCCLRTAILTIACSITLGSGLQEWLQTFATSDTSGAVLHSKSDVGGTSLLQAVSSGKSGMLAVEAKACMKYMDAELHPVIGVSIVPLQQALQDQGIADDGVTAVAALLHFEHFVGGTGRWRELLQTLGGAEGLPATWEPQHAKLLAIANVDLAWFQAQLHVLHSQAQLILKHVVLTNVDEYGGDVSEEQQQHILMELKWALAVTRAVSLPPMFSGDSVAVCPVFHAMPHDADAAEVQHTTSDLANVLGQTRTIVDRYLMPLPRTAGTPLAVRRINETGMCAHEVFFLFGSTNLSAPPCIPLKVTVPGLSAKPSALAVLRRTAMATGKLVPVETSKSHSVVFNLSPSSPFPTNMLRLLRLSSLQYGDAELFPASDAAGMLISLENELGALRSLRDALLSLKQRYQDELQQLVHANVIPEQLDALTLPQLRALQHNAKQMEAVNSLLDDCRDRWAAIFTADLTQARTPE